MDKEKVAAIVPALNEEKNVARVLEVLLSSKYLDEVILVDDGSTDKTAEIGKKLGVKVVRLEKIGGSGKGNVMKQGLKATDAKIIVFFDADLVGLDKDHVHLLVEPMIKENIKMCIGIRERLMGLPWIIAKIDPLMAIGGERAIRRELLENIPDKFVKGFSVEPALNYYCRKNKIPVKKVLLRNLDVIIKEKKWGFIKGFAARLRMMFEIAKIRLIFIFYKNEFIQKNNIR